jgi:hypothetical protein
VRDRKILGKFTSIDQAEKRSRLPEIGLPQALFDHGNCQKELSPCRVAKEREIPDQKKGITRLEVFLDLLRILMLQWHQKRAKTRGAIGAKRRATSQVTSQKFPCHLGKLGVVHLL